MRDEDRRMINPIAIGIAAAVGAVTALLVSKDENRQKIRQMYDELKGKAQDYMKSADTKTDEMKEVMRDDPKRKPTL